MLDIEDKNSPQIVEVAAEKVTYISTIGGDEEVFIYTLLSLDEDTKSHYLRYKLKKLRHNTRKQVSGDNALITSVHKKMLTNRLS